jgi:hypothetical protein
MQDMFQEILCEPLLTVHIHSYSFIWNPPKYNIPCIDYSHNLTRGTSIINVLFLVPWQQHCLPPYRQSSKSKWPPRPCKTKPTNVHALQTNHRFPQSSSLFFPQKLNVELPSAAQTRKRCLWWSLRSNLPDLLQKSRHKNCTFLVSPSHSCVNVSSRYSCCRRRPIFSSDEFLLFHSDPDWAEYDRSPKTLSIPKPVKKE